MNIGQGPDVEGLEEGWAFRSGNALAGLWSLALDAVALPLYAICGDGRLLFANSAARDCLGQGRWLQSSSGRINACLHHECAPSLGTALERLRRGDGSSVLLTCQKSGHQAVMTVIPFPVIAGSQDEKGRLGLVWLSVGDPENAAHVRSLSLLFKLTRAEEQLLGELARGADLREAASRLGVSIHTVRNQLKSVLTKTGRRSQVQLLTLLTRMASLRAPRDVRQHDRVDSLRRAS